MILPKGPSLSLQIFQLEPDTKCSFVMYVSPMRTTDRQCSHDALAVCMKCEAPLCVLHCEQCPKCHQELCEGCAALHSEDCGAMTVDDLNEMRLDQADEREDCK